MTKCPGEENTEFDICLVCMITKKNTSEDSSTNAMFWKFIQIACLTQILLQLLFIIL